MTGDCRHGGGEIGRRTGIEGCAGRWRGRGSDCAACCAGCLIVRRAIALCVAGGDIKNETGKNDEEKTDEERDTEQGVTIFSPG